MRSNYNTRWQDAAAYRTGVRRNADVYAQKAPLVYREGEYTREVYPEKYCTDEEVDALIEAGQIDKLSTEIVCRVAASKYLTFHQLNGFLTRQGLRCTLDDVSKRLERLVQCRFLRIVACRVSYGMALKCYCLGFNGFQLALAAGVPMHRGNQYLTMNRKKEMGLPREEAPHDIRRILAANQMILSLFGSNVQFCRFGIMETLLLPSGAREGALARTTFNIYLDEEDTLMYEIVRQMPDWQENLVNKIHRFARTVYAPTFAQENNWGLQNPPQLVLCGESREHNCEILEVLKNSGVFGEYPQLEVLFTCDTLVKQAPEKLYAFGSDGEIWYDLPLQTAASVLAA